MNKSLLALCCLAVLVAFVSFDQFSYDQLVGKNVIVTGATAGIGEEIAYLYCRNGANVVIVARNEEKMKAVLANCSKMGTGTHSWVKQDLSSVNDNDYKDVVQNALKELPGGKLDTLILNHVVTENSYVHGGWEKMRDMKIVRWLFDTNTFSYMSLAHHALDYLAQRESDREGSLIVVSSAAGELGLPRVAPYSASKHALSGFFESLSYDLKLASIPVSITKCVIGSIDTDNAKRNMKESRVRVVYHPKEECAQAIVRGGEQKFRTVYYPFLQTYPVVVLKNVVPRGIEWFVLEIFSGGWLSDFV